jgi:hypothetical protein
MRKVDWSVSSLPLALIVILFTGDSALHGAGKTATVPPPKFDKAVLDLFSADARDKIGPGKPGGGAPMAPGVPASTGGVASPSGDTPAAAGGSYAWSKLISPESLEAEVKSLAKTTVEVVKTPNVFKSGGNKITQTNYTELALLFGVIAEYDGEVRWKKDAPGLKALYGRAGINSKVGTDNSFKEARTRSEDLLELINGGNIDIPKADPDATWQAVANRAPLMRRLKIAQEERLSPWTGSKGDFTSRKDEVIREAQLMAAIAQVIKHESYEFADDSTYQGFLNDLQKQSVEVAEAAKSGNFDKAQSAMGLAAKACTDCHGGFR